MAKSRKYTDIQLIEAVASSLSVVQVLRSLGLVAAGGNYATIQRRIKEMDLDTSHWKGQGWSKGLKVTCNPPMPLADILVEESPYQNTHKLKERLLKGDRLPNKCSSCEIVDWLGLPLSFHLDHINGKRNDNRIENLRILCPNCHSQTETYCGRNIGKASHSM